jgi:hypothetical protein
VKNRGGNESEIPKAFALLLRPRWKPECLEVELKVSGNPVPVESHEVDFCRGRVVFDLEWNSKDQTFDRDLNVFREFHRYGKISVGVIVTRSEELNEWFKSLGTYENGTKTKKYSDKYGASTTHMGQLIWRLEAGRHGGCPVLVFGITTRLLKKE